MKIGLLSPFTGKSANPAEFARVAESLGFESICVPEHPALPVNLKTQFPGGGAIPPVYHQMADQVVAHDHQRQSGRADILLCAGVDQAKLGHIDLARQDVG